MDPTIPTVLQNYVDSLFKLFWPIIAALAAIGIFSFSVLEILKLFGVRRIFNYLIFRQWLKQNVGFDLKKLKKAEKEAKTEGDKGIAKSKTEDAKTEFAKIIDKLVDLSFGGTGKKWLMYSLPAEQLVGQINTSVQMALSFPSSDHVRLLANLSPHFKQKELVKLARDFDEPSNSQKKIDAENKFQEDRTEITNLVQRNLDALQVWIDRWWAIANHLAAVSISTVLIFLVFWEKVTSDNFQYWILLAILGGMVAPVAKDILAALKKVRDRDK